MRLSLSSGKAARGLALGLAVWLLVTVFAAMPAKAGGLALSGTFYRQDFNMPQGSSLSSPDVYVVVFNNSDDDFGIRMTGETILGVELVFSEDDFQLKAGEQKKVEIGVEVGTEAVPGEYKLSITAQAYKEAEGIQILGSAGQEADLTVTGDAASVEISTVSPTGEPLPAMIRLYRQTEEQTFDVGYSETGNLKTKVSPGKYQTVAYVAGKEVAEEKFITSANEDKKIQLAVKTVYFEGFGIVPNYQKDTGKLAMAKIVYAVNNLLQDFPQAEVVLKVSHDDIPLEEATLSTFSPLGKGKQEQSYNYIPAEGWQGGTYLFKLELLVGGEVYTTSPEKELEGNGNSPGTAGGQINWLILGIIAGGLVLVMTIIILVRRRAY